mgnify:CR=1 FL=1
MSANPTNRVQTRLTELGLSPPHAAAPAANSVPSAHTGNLEVTGG